MHWKRGKHVGESSCERILDFGFGMASESLFPRSRTFIPRRWETMVGTSPYLIVALLRRSGRPRRCAALPCRVLSRPCWVGLCCLVRCSCAFVRWLCCCCLRRVRSGGPCVLLRRLRAGRRCVVMSLRCAVSRPGDVLLAVLCVLQLGAAGCGHGRSVRAVVGACGRFSPPDRPLDFSR